MDEEGRKRPRHPDEADQTAHDAAALPADAKRNRPEPDGAEGGASSDQPTDDGSQCSSLEEEEEVLPDDGFEVRKTRARAAPH